MNTNQDKTREIILESHCLRFLFQEGDTTTKEVELKAGLDQLQRTFFHSKEPTEQEVENAINHIEEELTKTHGIANNNERLTCHLRIASELLTNGDQGVVSREQVEEIFNRYADYITGEPASILNIHFDQEQFVALLLIREVMYHLNFHEIELWSAQSMRQAA